MNFFSLLEQRAREIDSLLCVGLDPHPADLAENTPQAALQACLGLVEATQGVAAAYKPNAAFFEAYGAEGVAALGNLIAAIPDGIPVVLDAKRGDIASTAEAYARAVFQRLGSGAVTLSPYLGADSLAPFLAYPEKGVFLLCKTSNPGAADLQDLWVHGEAGATPRRLYEHVAYLAQVWDKGGQIGLVVGATHPAALRAVRAAAPEMWFLAPGLGAQGGDLAQALQAGLRADGLGLLVPVSRAVARAADPAVAADKLRQAMNAQRIKSSQAGVRWAKSVVDGAARTGFTPEMAALADGLLEAGCIRFGEFTLKSGRTSPIYIDLRRLAGFPQLLAQVAAAYLPRLYQLTFTRLAALPYAGLPIGTAISLQGGWPLVYPRKEVKAYGTRAEIEGPIIPGERVVVIDDLATDGGSKFEAIEKLEAAGLQVQDVVVLVDRQASAKETLAARGYHLHAVFTLTGLLDYWEANEKIEPAHIQAARHFLATLEV